MNMKNILALLFTFVRISLSDETLKCSRVYNGLCFSCAQDYFSFEEAVTYNNPFPIEDCKLKNNSVLELDVYVSDYTCSNFSLCDGSMQEPFDNLVHTFDFIHNRTRSYKKNIVQVFLLGEELFLLEKEIQIGLKHYFRRSLLFMTISPFLCSGKNIPGCKSEGESVKINMKTNQILFFIHGSLSVKNIIFFGGDMPLEGVDSVCYSEKKSCCDDVTYEDSDLLCTVNSDNIKNFIRDNNSFGLFNIEALLPSNSTDPSDYLAPTVTLDSCKFLKIMTLFPDNNMRFSSLFSTKDSHWNLTLKNLVFLDSSFLEGIVKQTVVSEASTLMEDVYYSKIKITNSSITNYVKLSSEQISYSIFIIENFRGSIEFENILLSETKTLNLILISIDTAESVIRCLNIYFDQNEGTSLIRCYKCLLLDVQGVVITNLIFNSENTNNLFEIKNSQNVLIDQVIIQESLFIKWDILPHSFEFVNINKNLSLSNIRFEKTESLTINIESSLAQLKNIFVTDSIINFQLITTKDSSLIFEQNAVSNSQIYSDSLIRMETSISSLHSFLIVSECQFVNLIFSAFTLEVRLFDWPFHNKNQEILFRKLIISNCFHEYYFAGIYLSVLKVYSFNKIKMENIDYSFISRGQNTLLFGNDIKELSLFNITFQTHESADYYLIYISCEKCFLTFTNITVDDISFTYGCFYFKGNIQGLFENFIITNIHSISPSELDWGFVYSFFRGLIVFWNHEICELKHWVFQFSQASKTVPSRLIYFLYNEKVTVMQIFFYNFEMRAQLIQTHLVLTLMNKIFIIQTLFAKNFFCQKSFVGNIFYEAALISFFNSDSFYKSDYLESQLILTNLTAEDCKFCKNGIVGLINIRSSTIKNASISFSENINGGAIAIYHGKEVFIENLKVINCSASQYGGALFLVGPNSILISNCLFSRVFSKFGGALFIKLVNIVTLVKINFSVSTGLLQGGVIYSTDSNIVIEGGNASIFQAFQEGGYLYMNGGSLEVKKEFYSIGGKAGRGGFIAALAVFKVLLTNITIKNVSAEEKGATFYLQDCAFMSLNAINLLDIYSETGVGNIFVKILSKNTSYSIANVICLRNYLFSDVFIHLDNALGILKILNINIRNIQILEGSGSIATLKSPYLIKDHKIIMQNISVLNLSTSFASGFEKYYINSDGLFQFESIFLILDHLYLKNVDIKANNYFNLINSDINFQNIVFLINKYPDHDIAIQFFIQSLNSSCYLELITFRLEFEKSIGFLSSKNSIFFLNNSLIWKCRSYFSTCLELFKSTVQINSSIFFENSGLDSGVLKAESSNITMENNIFRNNTPLDSENFKSGKKHVNNLLIFGKSEFEVTIIKYCNFSENYDGVSIITEVSGLKVFYSNFQGHSYFYKELKAVWCVNCNVEIFSTNFSNFSSKNGGTIRIENLGGLVSKQFFFRSSSISHSISDYGGSFSLIGMLHVNISQNIFINNKAIRNEFGEFGNFGVGVFICSNFDQSSMSMLNNIFLNNFAENGLASVFANFRIITYSSAENSTLNDTNTYINNTDGLEFTGNTSYLPIRANFSSKENLYMNKVLNFRSGRAFDLEICLLDSLEQELVLDDNSKALISETQKGNLSFLFIFNRESYSDRGKINFQNLIINAELNKTVEMQVYLVPNLYYIYPAHRKFFLIDNLNITFYSTPCEVGDIILESVLSCSKCPPSKYSLADPMIDYYSSNFNRKCLVCPSNAFCPGGSVIIPHQGFWRYSNKSSLIVECLSKFSCLGLDDGNLKEDQYIHGKCRNHSSGTLCYNCAPGYGRFSKKGVCELCANEFQSFLRLSIYILLFMIYSLVQIKLTFQLSRTSTAGILLKIIVTHFQQLGLISLTDLGWTPDFKAFFSLQDVFAFFTEDLLPLECFLQTFGFNLFTQKVIATNIYPLALSIFVFFSWVLFVILSISKRTFLKRKSFQIIQVTFFIVIVILFPEVISKCLSLFTCARIDDSESFTVLLYSPEVVCWSEEHVKFISYAAIPGLIFWGLISPLIIAFFLFKSRTLIKSIIEEGSITNSKYRVGRNMKVVKNEGREKAILLNFLFKGYSSNYFFWELIIFIKKFLLISIGCISDLFPSVLRGVILLVLISFLLLVHIRCQPYESSVLNMLEFFSLLTSFLTANIGILMFSYDFRNLSTPLLILVIIINATFLLFWAFLFLKETLGRNRIILIIRAYFNRRRHSVAAFKPTKFIKKKLEIASTPEND